VGSAYAPGQLPRMAGGIPTPTVYHRRNMPNAWMDDLNSPVRQTGGRPLRRVTCRLGQLARSQHDPERELPLRAPSVGAEWEWFVIGPHGFVSA